MTDMVLPQYGMGMTDGTIIAWHKAVGERVEQGEPICDVEAAKTTVEVGASHAGILLEILVPVGATVPVNSVIAVIGEQDVGTTGIPPSPPPPPSSVPPPSGPPPVMVSEEVKKQRPPTSQPEKPTLSSKGKSFGGQPQVEPRARRAARMHNIDLQEVRGTGPGGRIVEEDVIEHARTAGVNVAVTKVGATASVRAVRQIRIRCKAAPLNQLLDELASANNIHVPLSAALLKAASVAVLLSGVEPRQMCLRLGNGSAIEVVDPFGASLLAITSQLNASDRTERQAGGIVIELNSESWIDEIVSLDPAFPICLSLNQPCSTEENREPLWHITLSVQEEALSTNDAKLFLSALSELFANPLAMLA